MKRIRWFSAEWPVSMRTLASRMKGDPFKEDSTDGFIVERVRDDFVNARYIEKVSFQEVVTTPFGDERVFDRVLYRQLEFNLFSAFPNIELWDAPRNTQGYVSKLMQLNNFDVILIPLKVDVLAWAASLQKLLSSGLTLDALQISGLEIEPEVTARISINGNKDIRDALQRLTKGKKFDLDRIQMKVPYDGRNTTVQLINTGAAKLEECAIDDLLPLIRRALPSA